MWKQSDLRLMFERRLIWGFILLSLLLFTPVAVVVALTGDVYAQSKGQAYVFTERQRNQILLMAGVFVIVGIVSALGRS